MIPLEALRSREGAAYLGGAAVAVLIAALLTASTLLRFLHEEDVREAYSAAGRDEGNATGMLSKLRAADPRDVDVRVVLASIESERGEEDAARLEVAEKLFAEALALDPNREAALVGQTANALRIAMAATAQGRPAAVDHAAELLKSVPDGPDHESLEAAVLILRGRPAEALKKLEAPLEAPVSLGAMRSWTWNKAVAAILAHDGRALELALPAYVLRAQQLPGEWSSRADAPEFTGIRTDPSRMLAAAYRVSLIGAPGSPEVMATRCELARSALSARHDGGGIGILPGRFHPAGRDLGAGWNALGIAFVKLDRLTDAIEAFKNAAQVSSEPAYDFNYAEAAYRQAMLLPEGSDQRDKMFVLSASVYNDVLVALKRAEGREATRALAATNEATVLAISGRAPEGARILSAVDDKDFADQGRRFRNLGAIFDQAKNRDCIAAYKKAIELGGPDADQMQRRLRAWESRGNRR